MLISDLATKTVEGTGTLKYSDLGLGLYVSCFVSCLDAIKIMRVGIYVSPLLMMILPALRMQFC